MAARRSPMPRVLPARGRRSVQAKETDGVTDASEACPWDAPRKVRNTLIDFSSLDLHRQVRLALAEAFWSHVGVQSEGCIFTNWFHLRTFVRFAQETGAVAGLDDLSAGTLVRYIEWLNTQNRPDGTPWSKSARSGAYTLLRKLLQWLERCRPGTVAGIAYPFNPFPWRNRDTTPRSRMSTRALRAILQACETDIARIRAGREAARLQRLTDGHRPGTLGWLLEQIDARHGGIVPAYLQLQRARDWTTVFALTRHGGLKQVEPCLYPRGELLVPYYLAILIHAAGNPDPIAGLRRDCLQPLPLLDDREALVWSKARAHSVQRRTFSSRAGFEPPALVREVLEWSERLQPHAPPAVRDHLFLYKAFYGVTALNSGAIRVMVAGFCRRHGLERFSLGSIRPGVLASFYRVSGDLRRTSFVANHAHLSTTVRYVQAPEVQAQNRSRIAELQRAFIGHFMPAKPQAPHTPPMNDGDAAGPTASAVAADTTAVSMFGFDCTDPYAGIAPGSHRGQLCNSFMGCFTCPNAIITAQPATLARLLQARDHLRAAAATLHPARWQTVYEPQLRILEEDILPRFAASELAGAAGHRALLAPLPELR